MCDSSKFNGERIPRGTPTNTPIFVIFNISPLKIFICHHNKQTHTLNNKKYAEEKRLWIENWSMPMRILKNSTRCDEAIFSLFPSLSLCFHCFLVIWLQSNTQKLKRKTKKKIYSIELENTIYLKNIHLSYSLAMLSAQFFGLKDLHDYKCFVFKVPLFGSFFVVSLWRYSRRIMFEMT